MKMWTWVFGCVWAACQVAGGQVMTADGFESGNFDLWRIQTWNAENRGTIAAPPIPFEGNLAFRSVATATARENRHFWCELGRYFGDNLSERWWGFAVLFPEDWRVDSQNTVISQVYSKTDKELGETGGIVPALVLRLEGSKLILESRYDENEISMPEKFGKEGTVKNTRLWEGPLVLGEWMSFVFHMRFSSDPEGDGLLEVWKDNEKIVEARGPNTYNNQGKTTVRIGLYKRYTRDLGPSDDQVAWFDAFTVGGESSDFDSVNPKREGFSAAGKIPTDYEGPLRNQPAPAGEPTP